MSLVCGWNIFFGFGHSGIKVLLHGSVATCMRCYGIFRNQRISAE